jgi:hypothetical protein
VRLRARRAAQPPARDHHRHARALDKVVRGAAEQDTLQLAHPARANHEQRRADKVDDVEQHMPRVLHVPAFASQRYMQAHALEEVVRLQREDVCGRGALGART